jgi:hypothetical protein
MNNTDLPSLIRECVDAGASPVTLGEIQARATMTRPTARRAPAARYLPARRSARFAVAGAGLATAGVVGALVASQAGGAGAGANAVLTASVVQHMASASQAAMTSGQADIDWTSAGSAGVVQDIAFNGANFNDVSNPGVPGKVTTGPNGAISRTGESIDRLVDGRSFHWPAIEQTSQRPRFVNEWMLINAPGPGQGLNIPDPRTLLSVLSPSAGFVADGTATVDGVTVRHLRATTPGGVPVTPLNDVIQSEPDNAHVSALDVWVTSSGVVLKAQVTVSGTETSTQLTAAGKKALEQYMTQHHMRIQITPQHQAGVMALTKADPELAGLLKQPGMVTETSTPQSATVTVTFRQIGQPQPITVPPHYITLGGKS